jgi:hypothetical protein
VGGELQGAGDRGKGLAGVAAERVEHVCRESSPSLRCGSSGRAGDAGVGQDQQVQVSVVEVGADEPGRPDAVDEHQRGVEGALVLGREQANGRLGRKRVALLIAGVGSFESTLLNDAAAPSAHRRDRAPHRGQRPSATGPPVPASRRPASHVISITLPQAANGASKRFVRSVNFQGCRGLQAGSDRTGRQGLGH